MNCPICSWSPENPDYLPLWETRYWRVCLAPNQSLLGRCVIYSKMPTVDFADLTEEELFELLKVVRKLEASLQLIFGIPATHWTCYMSRFYREIPPGPHLHWWIIPAYDQPLDFGGLSGNCRMKDMSQKWRLEIAREIKGHLLSMKDENEIF